MNKSIVITGGSKGIGFATAEIFAKNGFDIFMNARHEVQLYDAIAKLQTKFPNVLIKGKPTDMRNKNEVLDFVNWVLQASPNIDVLVNNAGQFVPGAIHQEKEGTLEQMMEVNLYSAYHCTRAFLPTLLAKKVGHIFNICSIASLEAYPNGGSYGISKFALLGFSKNLREELKPHGIKVTAICPGPTLTGSWDGFDVDAKRIMEANDVAQMIFTATQLSPQAVVDDIVMQPQFGAL
jgi:short-subunit dehydrogenase